MGAVGLLPEEVRRDLSAVRSAVPEPEPTGLQVGIGPGDPQVGHLQQLDDPFVAVGPGMSQEVFGPLRPLHPGGEVPSQGRRPEIAGEPPVQRRRSRVVEGRPYGEGEGVRAGRPHQGVPSPLKPSPRKTNSPPSDSGRSVSRSNQTLRRPRGYAWSRSASTRSSDGSNP